MSKVLCRLVKLCVLIGLAMSLGCGADNRDAATNATTTLSGSTARGDAEIARVNDMTDCDELQREFDDANDLIAKTSGAEQTDALGLAQLVHARMKTLGCPQS